MIRAIIGLGFIMMVRILNKDQMTIMKVVVIKIIIHTFIIAKYYWIKAKVKIPILVIIRIKIMYQIVIIIDSVTRFEH